MKHASNKPVGMRDADLSAPGGEHAAAVLGLWRGSLGRTVRCVPTRRTVMVESGGQTLYAKLYRGRQPGAAAEWRWLHLLPMLAIAAPQPVARMAARGRSMVVMAALPGRSLDAWLLDAAREGWLDDLARVVTGPVAALVGRLFAQGLVHRDLNCAHLWVDEPRGAARVALLDLERVFRPAWRWRRWVVKDLAALLASSPVPVPLRVAVRFVRACLPDTWPAQRRELFAAVAKKARRVAGRRPRFG
ncbi:MAG: lipopolysaccharide kinase InaA family protein [Planctomycetota bacterium]